MAEECLRTYLLHAPGPRMTAITTTTNSICKWSERSLKCNPHILFPVLHVSQQVCVSRLAEGLFSSCVIVSDSCTHVCQIAALGCVFVSHPAAEWFSHRVRFVHVLRLLCFVTSCTLGPNSHTTQTKMIVRVATGIHKYID